MNFLYLNMRFMFSRFGPAGDSASHCNTKIWEYELLKINNYARHSNSAEKRNRSVLANEAWFKMQTDAVAEADAVLMILFLCIWSCSLTDGCNNQRWQRCGSRIHPLWYLRTTEGEYGPLLIINIKSLLAAQAEFCNLVTCRQILAYFPFFIVSLDLVTSRTWQI